MKQTNKEVKGQTRRQTMTCGGSTHETQEVNETMTLKLLLPVENNNTKWDNEPSAETLVLVMVSEHF